MESDLRNRGTATGEGEGRCTFESDNFFQQCYHHGSLHPPPLPSRLVNKSLFDKWFESRGISHLFSVIVRVRVLFRKSVVGD